MDMHESPRAHAVRADWHFAAVTGCQRMLCELAFPAPRLGERLARIASRMPLPVSDLEKHILHGMMADLAVRADRGRSQPGRAASALNRALGEQSELVERTQLARKAAARIEKRRRDRVNVTDVARHVGCDVTALRRLFLAEYGITMSKYHARVRVRHAIQLMLDETMSVAHLATAVGYASEKNFYEAVRRVTNSTPAVLRTLNELTLKQLANSLVPVGCHNLDR